MEGTIQVTIVSGSNLVSRDANGKSDPYCKVRLSSHKRQTCVKWKTLSPEWNETFNFIVKSIEDPLLIKVRDKDLLGRDDSLGFAFVAIDDLPPGEVVEKDVPLQDVDHGSIRITLLYTNIESSLQAEDPASKSSDRSRWPFHAIQFLRGEEVVVSPVPIVLENNVDGVAFFATNYRCVAVLEDSSLAWEIPLQTILRIERDKLSLDLHGKDLRVLRISMDVTRQREEDDLERVRQQVATEESGQKPAKTQSKRKMSAIANKTCEERCLFVFHLLLKHTFTQSQSKMFAFVHGLAPRDRSETAESSAVSAVGRSISDRDIRESNASFASARSTLESKAGEGRTSTPSPGRVADADSPQGQTLHDDDDDDDDDDDARPIPFHIGMGSDTPSPTPVRPDPKRPDGWRVYDPVKEFERLGVPSQIWRITSVNEQYTFSPTYPKVLVCPAKVSDADLIAVAKFRSKARIPVLSWKSPRTQATICRSSQPLVGLTRKRSKEDEALIRAVRQATPDNDASFYIIDARPRKNAVANTAKGAGFEDTSHYDNAAILFMNIHNIHVMRRSINKLNSAVYKSDNDDSFELWYNQQMVSGWLNHKRTVMQACNVIVDIIENERASVLVHCSDGWDRTAQLTSISEALLDPYYRTIEGLAVLIEKEWVSFGHKFNDRCGHNGLKKADQYSPIFIQYLDCMYQIVTQFPNCFEYNTSLLLFIADASYSCRYGTFLFNSDREREKARVAMRTVSLWTDVLQNKSRFTNPLYRKHRGALIPSASVKVMQIWREYFMRWNPALQPQKHNQSSILASIRLTRAVGGKAEESTLKMSRFALDIEDEETLRDLDAEIKPDGDDSEDSENESEDDMDEFDDEAEDPSDPLVRNSSEEVLKRPFKRDSEATARPQWVQNKHAKECFECMKKFSLIKRRHHCRHCGLLFCSSCTANRVQIPQMGYRKAVRVCIKCFELVWRQQLESKARKKSSAGRS